MIWPASYGPAERDQVYKTFSLSGWPGRSGHDAPMIALDALLGSGSDWEELMSRAAFHGGECLNEGKASPTLKLCIIMEVVFWGRLFFFLFKNYMNHLLLSGL